MDRTCLSISREASDGLREVKLALSRHAGRVVTMDDTVRHLLTLRELVTLAAVNPPGHMASISETALSQLEAAQP